MLPLRAQKSLVKKYSNLMRKQTTIGVVSDQLMNINSRNNSITRGVTKRIFDNESETNIRDNFQDTKIYEYIYIQYRYNCMLQLLFSFISIISAIINYEGTMTKKSQMVIQISSWVAVVSSILLYLSIVVEYYIKNMVVTITTRLPMKYIDNRVNRTYLLLYILIFVVTPLPFFHDYRIPFYNSKYNCYYEIPINGILTLVCMFRMWFLIKCYLVCCRYYKPRAQRICNMNGFNTNLYFASKGMMLTSPFQISGILYGIVLFYSSYGIRIFESGIDDYSGLIFSNIWNCLWCLVITMTTTGYGDITPSTELGRFLVIVSCFCGVILLSLIIVSITNVLNLQGNEHNIYIMLERLDVMADKDATASILVSKYVRLFRKLKKKQRINVNYERDDFAYTMHVFKSKVKELDNSFPAYSGMDNIRDHLVYLEKSSHGLYEKYNDISKLMDKVVEKLNIKF
jgi:hypothetical protein